MPTAHRAAAGYQRGWHVAAPIAGKQGGPQTAEQLAVLLASLLALLFRFSRQELMNIDVLLAESSHAYASWAASVTIDGDISISGFAALLSAPLRELLDAVEPPRSSRAPTSNVAITLTSSIVPDAEAVVPACCERDLHLVLAHTSTGLELGVAYNSLVLSAPVVERWAESANIAVTAALRDTSVRIRNLPVMTRSQAERVSSGLDTASAADFQPVHRLFEAEARHRPDAPAVTFRDHTLTYGELDQAANALALELERVGASAGAKVAVCVQPSLHIVIALLAILKAGCIYVPLDPTHPAELVEFMLDDAQAKVVLTQKSLSALTQPERFAQILLDDRGGAPTASEPPTHEVTEASSSHLLFTSGTTGKPKAVLGTHGNLAQYLRSARNAYGFSERDTFCSLARYTFSISLFELLSPLCCGASLILLDRDEVLSPDRLVLVLGRVSVVHAGRACSVTYFVT